MEPISNCHGATALVGQGFLIVKDSLSYSDTPHSAGLLWKSDQPNAETSDNTQHSQETDIHVPPWDSNPQSQQVSSRKRMS